MTRAAPIHHSSFITHNSSFPPHFPSRLAHKPRDEPPVLAPRRLFDAAGRVHAVGTDRPNGPGHVVRRQPPGQHKRRTPPIAGVVQERVPVGGFSRPAVLARLAGVKENLPDRAAQPGDLLDIRRGPAATLPARRAAPSSPAACGLARRPTPAVRRRGAESDPGRPATRSRRTSAGDALTNTPARTTRPRTASAIARAISGRTYLGLAGKQFRPMASAPASAAMTASSGVVMPQILIRNMSSSVPAPTSMSNGWDGLRGGPAGRDGSTDRPPAPTYRVSCLTPGYGMSRSLGNSHWASWIRGVRGGQIVVWRWPLPRPGWPYRAWGGSRPAIAPPHSWRPPRSGCPSPRPTRSSPVGRWAVRRTLLRRFAEMASRATWRMVSR